VAKPHVSTASQTHWWSKIKSSPCACYALLTHFTHVNVNLELRQISNGQITCICRSGPANCSVNFGISLDWKRRH